MPDSGSRHEVAVVIGGSESVDQEAMQTSALLAGTDIEPVFFVVNDKIPRFAQIDHAVTLHPIKMENWLSARSANGLPSPESVWSFWEYPGINKFSRLPHWQGSSGLYAIKIARELGFEKIILCGVPMTKEGNHFLRKRKWQTNLNMFRRNWIAHKEEIIPFVRSWSGWTAELLGTPNKDWLLDALVTCEP